MSDHMVFLSHSSKDSTVTQLICHRIEEEGIPCWMAPRDIKHGDWAGSIMDGLRRCDICVVVVSENSIDSGEVTKEITEATHSCSYIIPFKLDLAELNDRMRYHLGPCHWLDASMPPIEKRIQELIQRIRNLSDEDNVYLNSRQLKLMDRIVWPKALFLGREAEVETIAHRLNGNHILFLQGMGGIGKSEIAKSYAKKYRDHYDTILFLRYESTIMNLVCSDEVMIENLAQRDTETESMEQYFIRKMGILRKISSERILIILDNYDVDEDADFMELANCDFHLLVTTRNEHEDFESLKIGPIEDFELVRKLFYTSYGKTPKEGEEEIIDQMLRLVGCHTITVELIAKQMKASRKKPVDMLELLRSVGTNTGLREKVKREGEVETGSAFSYIRRLFKVSELEDESCQLLQYMTIVPIAGIDISMLYDICELESYDVLNELIAHNWLMIDENTDMISMHPIIADVVQAELEPNGETCGNYIKGVVRVIGNLWFASREERTEKWPLYEKILSVFPEPNPMLWDSYFHMFNNAWICGKYELAITMGHKVLEMVQREFPEDNYIIGRVARGLGGCYHNAGDDISAEPYYELGLECQKAAITKESPVDVWNELAHAYQKVGRCAYLREDYEKSRYFLKESEKIAEEYGDEILSIGDTLTELCRLNIAEKKYEEALGYCKKSLDFFQKLFGDESPNHAYCYTDFGRCYTALGRFKEAQDALNHALEINLKYHGEINQQTFVAREAMGNLALAKGNMEEAKHIFTEMYLQIEQNFGEKNIMLKKLSAMLKEIQLSQIPK